MPSTYLPPDTIVEQLRKTVTAARITPQLPVCIVGPATQIITSETAGIYTAGSETTLPLPSLAAGATVDPTSLVVVLDAVNTDGTPIGQFKLDLGTTDSVGVGPYGIVPDAVLVNNNTQLRVYSGFGLEYSVLSARNNNIDTLDNDVATGTANTVFFDDAQEDFSARGVTEDGNTILTITSPVQVAGRYVVRGLINDTTSVNKVTRLRVEKLAAGDVREQHTQLNSAGSFTGNTRLLKGFSTATTLHVRAVAQTGGSPAGSATIVNGGSGYSVAPTVAVIGDGSGASAVATVSGGAVTGVTITGGTLYTNVTLVFTPVSGGSGAIATKVPTAITGGFGETSNVLSANDYETSNSVAAFNAYSDSATGDTAGNSTVAAIGAGVGVATVLSTVTTSTAINNIFSTTVAATTVGTTMTLPSRRGTDAAWFAPGAPVTDVPSGTTAASPVGRNTPEWVAIMAAVKTGDWLRFKGTFGGTVEYRDYQVQQVDLGNSRLYLANPDGVSGTGADFTGVTVASGASLPYAAGITLTNISLLRCFKGSADSVNGAGDVLVTVSGTTTYRNEIKRATPYYIELVNALPTLTSGTYAFKVERGIGLKNTELAYDLTKRQPTGFYGNVLVSYKAVRSDLAISGLLDIASQQDIEDKIGVIHPSNPLALGCDFVTRSGLTDGNRVFFALATADATDASFIAALDTLSTEDVYFVVPLTNSKTVIQAYAAHVTAMSQPNNKLERILLATSDLPVQDLVIPASLTTTPPTGRVGLANDAVSASFSNLADGTLFYSPNIDWNLVKAGSMLQILGASTATASSPVLEERRIKSVDVTNKRCTLFTAFSSTWVDPDNNNTTAPPTVYFAVRTFPRTKAQQAEAWRDEAAAYDNVRVRMVRPHSTLQTYTDKTGSSNQDIQVVLPSYFAAASVAGLMASVPASQPLTNAVVAGIDKLFYSNTYFTPDMLNTIAEGGNLILYQPSRTSAVSIRHQLTTAMDSIELREHSIQSAIDFAAKYFRTAYRTFIGKHNITNELLTQLRGIGEAIMRSLIDGKIVAVGSRLLNVFQDPDAPDSVIVEVSWVPLYPCNRITVRLYI